MTAISIDLGVDLRIAAALGIFTLLWTLAAMFRRESVKRDLRERGCKPIRIWWTVIDWRVRWYDSVPFRVIYSDPNQFVHKACCWVGHGLMASPFGPRRVVWVKDEIIGEVPLPEVSSDIDAP
jgi:hypothetical protein